MKNPKSTKEQRRQLRKDQTNAEQILWKELRNRRLNGIKFRRQYGIECYILDFFSPEFNLAIEVDGGIHQRPDVKVKDKNKEAFLHENGINLLRFSNAKIENELRSVLTSITSKCVEKPHLSSPSKGEGLVNTIKDQ